MLVIVVNHSNDFQPYGASYFGLVFFDTILDVANYVATATKCGYYVQDIYDTEIRMMTDYKVRYDIGTRSVSSAIINDKYDNIYRIDRDPYDVTKKWKITELKDDSNYS